MDISIVIWEILSSGTLKTGQRYSVGRIFVICMPTMKQVFFGIFEILACGRACNFRSVIHTSMHYTMIFGADYPVSSSVRFDKAAIFLRI